MTVESWLRGQTPPTVIERRYKKAGAFYPPSSISVFCVQIARAGSKLAGSLPRRMNEKLIREIGRSQRLEILTALRRRGGMSVKEMAAHFQMSYMGIKQHCLDLEQEGYLDTARRPKPVGRPEIVYRLTPLAFELFPGGNNELTLRVLEAIAQSYGPAAPAKLLFTIFGQRWEKYQPAGAGVHLVARAAALAKLRNAEGYMAELENDEAAAGTDYPPDPAGSGSGEEQPGLPLEVAGHADRPVVRVAGFRVVSGAKPPEPAGNNGVSAISPAPLRIIEHHSPLEDLLRRFPIIARLERELFERVLRCRVEREEQCEPGVYRCVFHLRG
jgi:predicted ArsR family transcriptional regulator